MPKVFLITGGSSGFGLALAKVAVERGDRVVVGARRLEAMTPLAKSAPDRALALTLDVTDDVSRRAAVSAAIDRFGQIDVLANIAGRGSLGAAEEFTPEQLREQMEVNFFSAVEMTRAVLPVMRSQGSGHILNLTSIGGLAAYPGFAPYCASKFALEGWSEALSGEVAPLGIRVTIVEPGAFRTEFAGDSNMRPKERIDAYRAVIEPVEQYLYGSDGKQPGDPAKAAAAMIAVVEHTHPPMRLLLGTDALGLHAKKQEALARELEAWRATSEDTAFPGATVAPVGG